MVNSFREEDVVARLGGDEYIVMLSGVEENFVISSIERLSRKVKEYNTTSNEEYELGFSYGYSLAQNFKDINKIISSADKHLYENKRAKKSTRIPA